MKKKTRKPAKTKFGRFCQDIFLKKPLAGLGLIILIFLLFVAIFADVLAPTPLVNGDLPTSILNKLKPPSLEHPFGTDTLGRDLLSYMIYGARTSVILAVFCTVISTVISVAIGVTSAAIGGWFDLILQRFVDAWTCIPGLLITLILMAMLGNGIPQMILVLSVPGAIGGSRMIRGTAISVKDMEYVKMGTRLGGTKGWNIIHHIIPNIMPMILMSLAGSIGGVVMSAASLSFLGYGVNPTTPDWGAMLTSSGRSNMYSAPWLAIIPGLAIALMVFAAAMFADGVRDILDPRLSASGVGTYRLEKKRGIIATFILGASRKRKD